MKTLAKQKQGIKEFIQRYICIKILNNPLNNELKIESENELADKFKCSRLTARNALMTIAIMGVLVAKKGSGYAVSEDAVKILSPAFYLSLIAKKITRQIKTSTSSNSVVNIVNTYYGEKNLLLGTTIFIIENSLFSKIHQTAEFKQSNDFAKLLIDLNLIASHLTESLEISNKEFYLVRNHFDENMNLIYKTLSTFNRLSFKEKKYF